MDHEICDLLGVPARTQGMTRPHWSELSINCTCRTTISFLFLTTSFHTKIRSNYVQMIHGMYDTYFSARSSTLSSKLSSCGLSCSCPSEPGYEVLKWLVSVIACSS